MKAKISVKQTIAEGTIYLEFTTENPISFQAGQFLEWTLINPPFSDVRGNNRNFTIAHQPNNNTIALATRLSESAFKKSLAQMNIGDEIEISDPHGSFLLPELGSEIIMLAGGIGITPFISQLKEIEQKHLDYKIKLLYFNRNEASTAWLTELTDLSKKLPNFEFIPIMSDSPDWKGESGRVSAELINKYSLGFSTPTFMVVGPPKMVEATNSELMKLEIPEDKIKLEAFSGY
jgi:ferredoxin-NADP reductase